jgi:hypothetical protein
MDVSDEIDTGTSGVVFTGGIGGGEGGTDGGSEGVMALQNEKM